MTPTESPTLWLPPFSLVVLDLLIGLISFACPLIPFSLTGQAFLLIAVLRAFCGWPPMVRWVASMPVPHRAVFALMIGSMILGHYTLTARTYFPCVAWEIFPFVDERD